MTKKHGHAKRGLLDTARCPECARWFTPTGLTHHRARIHGKHVASQRTAARRPRSRYLGRRA